MDRPSSRSTMIFAPSLPRRRLQLRISERRLLLMVGDALAVVAAVLLALRIWAWVADAPFNIQFVLPQLPWFFVLTGLWFAIASANDFYDLASVARRVDALQRLMVITLQQIIVYVIVFFFSDRDALPRLFIIYYGTLSFALVAIWRVLNPALLGWASAPRRTLIIGVDWSAQTIIETLKREAETTYEVIGCIGDAADMGKIISGIPVLGQGMDLMNYVRRENISELILCYTRELPGEVFQGVMDAYEAGVVITPMPIIYERITERVPVEHVGDNWTVVLPVGGTSVFNPYPVLKRLFDIVLSSVALLGFLILLPFIAILIRLDSPGPVFYRQMRVGLNGRHFSIIKLRTMVQDAEKLTGAVFAQANDVRVTRLGRFLRKTRLDELPQLFNILRGDMSLVGPRPERPEHVARLQQKIPFYRTRHTIRPGATGWAQVRYRYGADDHDAMVKLQYDLYYIRHRSLLLDFTILVRTVGKMVRMSGQ